MMNDVEKKTSCRNKYQNIESIVAKEEFLLQADDFAFGNACIYFGVNYVENSLEIWKINYHKSRGSFVTNRLLHTFQIHILWSTKIFGNVFQPPLSSVDHPPKGTFLNWKFNFHIKYDIEMIPKRRILEERGGRHAALNEYVFSFRFCVRSDKWIDSKLQINFMHIEYTYSVEFWQTFVGSIVLHIFFGLSV